MHLPVFVDLRAERSAFRTYVLLQKDLEKFETIYAPDKISRVIVSGDVSRIFRKDISDDLADGIIAFFFQSVVGKKDDPFDLFFVFVAEKNIFLKQ